MWLAWDSPSSSIGSGKAKTVELSSSSVGGWLQRIAWGPPEMTSGLLKDGSELVSSMTAQNSWWDSPRVRAASGVKVRGQQSLALYATQVPVDKRDNSGSQSVECACFVSKSKRQAQQGGSGSLHSRTSFLTPSRGCPDRLAPTSGAQHWSPGSCSCFQGRMLCKRAGVAPAAADL